LKNMIRATNSAVAQAIFRSRPGNLSFIRIRIIAQDDTKRAVDNAADKVKENAQGAMHKVKETVHKAGEFVSDTAHKVADGVKGLAISKPVQGAKHAAGRAGEKMVEKAK
ncbi:hypothetical protein PENTCL1PPCAC_18611, partial [Pristionchus entomophagus]